jgi:hypothetical protein
MTEKESIMSNKDIRKLKASLAKAKEKLKDLTEKPKYSLEVIRRYRQMEDRNAFHQEVKKRVPIDLGTDRVTLACGHKEEMTHSFLRAATSLNEAKDLDNKSPLKVLCMECRKQ